MTQAIKDQDQSMEDILQSIKRIIAEEGEAAPATDVLELVDMLPEDDMPQPLHLLPMDEESTHDLAGLTMDEIMAGANGKIKSSMLADPPAEEMPPVFVKMLDDIVTAEPLVASSDDELTVAPVITPPPAPDPIITEPPPPPEPPITAPPSLPPEPVVTPPPTAPVTPMAEEESLISDTTLAATASALSKLKAAAADHSFTHLHSPHFRSGTTVEELVLESLRPMLREWLDDNLTETIERLVERELRKISAR